MNLLGKFLSMSLTDLPATALAAQRNSTVSTFWHRVHGRPSRSNKTVNRQYLDPSKGKALKDCVLRMAGRGYFVSVKFLRYLAQEIVRRRSSTCQTPTTNDGIRPPCKNWPQDFYKRHPELKSRILKPLERERYNIHEKVA
jgi:hypothetical protein